MAESVLQPCGNIFHSKLTVSHLKPWLCVYLQILVAFESFAAERALVRAKVAVGDAVSA